MAKKLAIEWDAREMRVVAGVIRGGKVTITDVASTPLSSNEATVLAETLKGLLRSLGLEKLPAMVALGRGRAELRELKLPPVPDAELPDMVRFQAIRTFAAAGERAAIDYLPTRRDEDGIRVVAAAVVPEELKTCAQLGAASGLPLERVVLRPLAAAALFRRSGQDDAGETVLIDLLADEADIVVLRDGTPAFVRSIRLPDNPAVGIRTLAGEVRRSLMACQEGQDEAPSERRIILWGRADVHAEEVRALGETLKTPVLTLDPFSIVSVEAGMRARMPEHVGRLAPLVGLLDADARGGADLIDFINPRRPPEPVNNRNRYIIIGGAAAALVALVLFFGWKKMAALDNEIAALETAYEQLDDDVEKADLAISKTARVDRFLDGNVFWLGEIGRAVAALPPSDQAIVNSITARVDGDGGGALTLAGGVTDSEKVSELERDLRDEAHRVVGKGTGVTPNMSPYNWSFNETIFVGADYVRQSREETVQTASAQTTPERATSERASDATTPEPSEDESAPPPNEGDADEGEASEGEANDVITTSRTEMAVENVE